jgi:type VI secretion system secreted protein VgrG
LEDEPPFRATYGLLPTTEQYRPRRVTPKPSIVGPQTAVVVGRDKTANPESEEIVTDPFGRVRVGFHWERIGDRHPEIRGPKDGDEESSTCWVRVAQIWAGSRWGAIYIPRVGQEVVVDFLEGDPDRPLTPLRGPQGKRRVSHPGRKGHDDAGQERPDDKCRR